MPTTVVIGAGKMSPKDLIAVVKKTPFDDSEAQRLIDVLLNKQSGGGSVSNDWVDTGKGGQQNEVKKLQTALVNKEAASEEEAAKVKSITDRMNVRRTPCHSIMIMMMCFV